ncbi:nuclear transport factor 2 family protein [Siphonobacter curvatus]|nr:nuclear transport factor 2 family protein [Siphonobacter curvatus]
MKKIVLTSLLGLGVFSVQAQQAEEPAIRAVVDRLFEGMAKKDTNLVRSVFHPSARLQATFVNGQGQPVLKSQNIDVFVKAIGSIPSDTNVEERITSCEIRVDDRLATAWAFYEFYANKEFSHKGVDAFQFYKTEQGWKIIQLSDTRRK